MSKEVVLVHKNESAQCEAKYDWTFVMCENCYWSASLFNARQTIDLSSCQFCHSKRPLAVVPIASNEIFTFSYSEKHGVELDFMPRKHI